MSTLRPCDSCRRHVRQGTTACPFCGKAPGAEARVEVPRLPRVARDGRARAALLFAGATLLSAGCGSASSEPATGATSAPTSTATTESAGDEESTPEPVSGTRSEEAPIPPAVPPDDADQQSIGGEGQLVPMYGTPN
jgi:hypothetical protein